MGDTLHICGDNFTNESIRFPDDSINNLLANTEVGSFIITASILQQNPLWNDLFPTDQKEVLKMKSLLFEKKLENKTVVFAEPKQLSYYLSLIGDDSKYEITTIDDFLLTFPKTIEERKKRILMNFYNTNSEYGAVIDIVKKEFLYFFASNNDELRFIKDYLQDCKLLKYGGMTTGTYHSSTCKIEIEGWKLLEEYTKKNNKQVFVAMAFRDETNLAYEKIAKAIIDTGFRPYRIDKEEHLNNITTEIMYEIKRSEFIITDSTYGNQGAYYEAGYATGLGIPVIWTCKHGTDDELKQWMHFDTRQINHVLWDDEDDLYKKLIKRIKGSILIDKI